MKITIREYMGDVYRRETPNKDGGIAVTFHIGSKNARSTREDSGKGRMLVYLLTHLGETFGASKLAKEINMEEISIKQHASTFDCDFKDSRFYEFVIEGRNPTKYGIFKR